MFHPFCELLYLYYLSEYGILEDLVSLAMYKNVNSLSDMSAQFEKQNPTKTYIASLKVREDTMLFEHVESVTM